MAVAKANWMDDTVSMVADCEQRIDLLNEWEKAFIESMRSQVDRAGFVIRPRQATTLEGIWERVSINPVTGVKHGNA